MRISEIYRMLNILFGNF